LRIRNSEKNSEKYKNKHRSVTVTVNLSDFVYFFCCSKINPVENKLVSLLTGGEGWHNYHHTFPSDYRTSEYGHKHDISTAFIEIMQRIGWAYDLKKTPQHLVNQWIKKYGDGSHSLYLEVQNATDKI